MNMKLPSISATLTAARNAARDITRYGIEVIPGSPFLRVVAPTGAYYLVSKIGCECPFFAEEGICKHVLIANDYRNHEAAAIALGEEMAYGREALESDLDEMRFRDSGAYTN